MSAHLDDFILHEYVDGVLGAAETSAVETHLHECADCQQKVAALQTLFAQFARLVEEDVLEEAPSASFAAQVMTVIAAQSSVPLAVAMPWKFLLVQLVAAVALLALLGTLFSQVIQNWVLQRVRLGELIALGNVWSLVRTEMIAQSNQLGKTFYQMFDGWGQLLNPPSFPQFSLLFWLPLLVLSCLLWLAATRWLILKDGVHYE